MLLMLFKKIKDRRRNKIGENIQTSNQITLIEKNLQEHQLEKLK